MFEKKKKTANSSYFSHGPDPKRSLGAPSVLSKTDYGCYKRYNTDLVSKVQENTGKSLVNLAGVRLRPSLPDPGHEYGGIDSQLSSNDIVDFQKLEQAQAESQTQHTAYVLKKQRPSTRHVPRLKLVKRQNQGFGVTVYYRCTQCKFQSSDYKLYETTASGGCLTNLQASVGLCKTAIKSSDASFLFSTLNLNGPSRKTLQNNFSKVNEAASQVLESALVKNRGVVKDYIAIQSSAIDPVPAVAVAFDGQYDVPLYHGYDGKSNSVSEPVLEAETGMNLMISHAVVSKLDGSYEKDKVGEL